MPTTNYSNLNITQTRSLLRTFQKVLFLLESKNKKEYDLFICDIIKTKIFTPQHEHKIPFVINFLLLNKPTKHHHKEFYNHKAFIDKDIWWTKDLIGYNQRIKFLQKINKELNRGIYIHIKKK